MASGHCDQRKNDAEAEANSISTEYARADLLFASDAGGMRELLKRYLDQRLRFYQTRDEHQLEQINAQTARLQSELWSVVEAPLRSSQRIHNPLSTGWRVQLRQPDHVAGVGYH